MAFVLESALFSTLAALLPHYESKFGMSTFSSGILAGAYTGGMIVGILVAGLWASDRLGVRTTALTGCGLLALASLAFGFAGSVLALDLARLTQGIGAGLVWCALVNWLILVIPPERRSTALGAALGAAVFGTAAGPLLGAATQVVGTVAVFAFVAVAVLAYASVLARTPAPREAAAQGPLLARLRLPHDPPLRRITYVGLVPPLLVSAVTTIFPLQMAALGAGEAAIDVALLTGALLCALCCTLAGSIADRDGPLRPIVGGVFTTIVALAAMAAADSPLALALGYVLFQSAGLGFFWIPQMGLFAKRGDAIGMSPAAVAMLLNLALTAAYTVGPPLLTALKEATGNAVPYLVMAGAALLTLVALLGLRGVAEPAERASVQAETG